MNKAAFAKVDFKYSFALSAIHMACNFAGSQYVFWSQSQAKAGQSLAAQLLGNPQRQTLDSVGQKTILAFSIIFSLNIAIGNVSLKHVSVNFNQVMRSLVPVLTIVFGILQGKTFTLSLIHI